MYVTASISIAKTKQYLKNKTEIIKNIGSKVNNIIQKPIRLSVTKDSMFQIALGDSDTVAAIDLYLKVYFKFQQRVLLLTVFVII